MSDDEQQLLKIGLDAALKPLVDLSQRLFGGLADQIGGIWEDAALARRIKRRIRLLEELKADIDRAQFEPRVIPDAIWMPIVEEASRQDDESIQDKWAAMLANAADPRRENPISPVYPSMLRDLTAREVRFLDDLYRDLKGVQTLKLRYGALEGIYARFAPVVPHPMDTTGLPDFSDFKITLDVLERNRILAQHYIDPTFIQTENQETFWTFTRLGYLFVESCQKPKPTPNTQS